jgi:hypothetical protein
MRTFNRALAALAGLLATASGAAAAPVTLTFENVGPGVGSAGQYNWNTNPTVSGILYTPFGNGSSSANHFVAFCIERSQFINPGAHYSNYLFAPLESAPVPGPAMSHATADSIREMWAQFRPGVDTSNESMAFQNAVWHLVDPSYNPGLSGTQLSLYSSYLNPANWHSGFANLAAMVNGDHQDQIFELKPGYTVQNGDIVPTPAPAALVVASLLAPALLWRCRRTRAGGV